MHVHHPVDDGIDLVHDEDLWISRYKGVETHVKVRWGGLVADLLGDGGWCIGIRVHLQAVVMELVFNAEKFCFGDRMVCVCEIEKGVIGSNRETWVRFIGERIVGHPVRHSPDVVGNEGDVVGRRPR